MERIKSHKLVMGICGLAAVGLLAAASQGCSSSSTPAGGTGGTGGTSNGTGGHGTGVGGSTGAGTGGSTVVDAGPPLCTGTAPTSASIADFTVDGGATGVPTGGPYNFAAPGLVAPTLRTDSGSLVATIATGPVTGAGNNYAGFGVPFNACTDASAYTAVKFSISGTLSAACSIQFSVLFTENAAPTTGSPAGRDACVAASCYPPAKIFTLPATAATDVTVAFADVTGGAPLMAIDKARVTGVQWQLTVPAGDAGGCNGTVTVDNVVFVP